MASLVIEPDKATIYLYYINSSGQAVLLKAVNNVRNTTAINFNGGYTLLGDDPYDLSGRVFNGSMAGAAIYNHALTESQLQRMFGAGIGFTGPDFPPSFVTQPAATNTSYSGFTVQISATSSGTAPITNQWRFNGTNLVDGFYYGTLIKGSTSNVLTVAGATTNWAGVYNLVLSNDVASVTSSNSVLNVLSTVAPPGPANLIGAWLTGPANLADQSGYTPGGIHDGYGATGAGVAASNYAFTNDVPYGATGQSLWLKGNTAIAISNSATVDGVSYTNTYDDGITNSFSVVFWAKGYPGNWNPWVSKYGEGPGWRLGDEGDNSHSGFTLRAPSANRGTVTVGSNVYGDNEDTRGTIGSNNSNWHL
jgi:hypothetical protein